jgi:hypothetical protein
VVTQHNLRGKILYRTLTVRETYTGEEAEEEESDLAYLHLIRRVRDEEPALFERVKQLPRKARAGWARAEDGGGEEETEFFGKTRFLEDGQDSEETGFLTKTRFLDGARDSEETEFLSKTQFLDDAQVVTFFRLGALKKFFVADARGSREIDFFQAADLMGCERETPPIPIPPVYYELLGQNKAGLAAALEDDPAPRGGGGHSNAQKVLKNIRAAQKDNRKMTDEDEDYLRAARRAFEEGRIPRKASQRIMQRINRERRALSGLRVLAILRAELDDDLIFAAPEQTGDGRGKQREIILSAYLK